MKNRVTNEDLFKEIKIYKESGIKTEELGRMLLLLATRYANRGNFASYTWKDDMISDAVYTCLKYMDNIDIEREGSNPLNYFQRTIWNSLRGYIGKQKKHIKIKDLCYNNADLVLNEGFKEDEVSFFDIHAIDYQQIRGDKKKKRKPKKK
jgi:hypothetical protein